MGWKDLSIRDKAAIIRQSVSDGIYNLGEIRNSFDEGGDIENSVVDIDNKGKEFNNNFLNGRTIQYLNNAMATNPSIIGDEASPFYSAKTNSINSLYRMGTTNYSTALSNLPRNVAGEYFPDYQAIGYNGVPSINTAVHENAHALGNVEQFIPKQFLSKQPIGYSGDWIEFDNYLDDPDEIYSRRQSFFQDIDFNPMDVMSRDGIKKYRESGKLGEYDLDRYSDDYLLMLFNQVANNQQSADYQNVAAKGGKKDSIPMSYDEELGLVADIEPAIVVAEKPKQKPREKQTKEKTYIESESTYSFLQTSPFEKTKYVSPLQPVRAKSNLYSNIKNDLWQDLDNFSSISFDDELYDTLGLFSATEKAKRAIDDIKFYNLLNNKKDIVQLFNSGGDKNTINHQKYNAEQVNPMYDYLRESGLTNEQASGLLGNLAVESYLNADMKQANGPAYGLMQAEGSRKKAMLAYNRTPYSFGSGLSPEEQQQLDYIIDKGIQNYTPGEWGKSGFNGARHARNAFLNAKTTRRASDIITNNFLRPGKPNLNRRRVMSDYYYNTQKERIPYQIESWSNILKSWEQ